MFWRFGSFDDSRPVLPHGVSARSRCGCDRVRRVDFLAPDYQRKLIFSLADGCRQSSTRPRQIMEALLGELLQHVAASVDRRPPDLPFLPPAAGFSLSNRISPSCLGEPMLNGSPGQRMNFRLFERDCMPRRRNRCDRPCQDAERSTLMPALLHIRRLPGSVGRSIASRRASPAVQPSSRWLQMRSAAGSAISASCGGIGRAPPVQRYGCANSSV